VSRPFRASCLALALLALVAGPLAAQSQNSERPLKRLQALRINGESPKIDGQFDEEFWLKAPSIDDFLQQDPDNMAPPRERTVVQVAYDDRYLYVAARCYVRSASSISAGLGRRGAIPASDKIGIGLDPRHDRLTAYYFTANPSGVQNDMSLFNDTREDNDYEAVWEVGTSISEEGWNAEFRIPFSQVRFTMPDAGDSVWGLQVRRDVLETGEVALWNAQPRGTQGNVSQFGELIFNERLSPPRRLELLPFTLARHEREPEESASSGLAAGIDLRVGLGTAATLSATINPDFGQVELDPAVLNLSVFETFFPEKRPFFLEDSRVFVPPFNQFPMFHSRRIGKEPGRFELADNETLVSKPGQTTILGAVKVSGKGSGWTYGGLTALTAREFGIVDVTQTDADGVETTKRERHLLEPRTLYSVGRVQRDILHATSNVGAIATGVMREQDLDAYTAGGDYNIRWAQNRYITNGHWVVTHAPIDGKRRTDFGGASNFEYAGKYLGVYGHYDHFGREFRNTDLGFLNGRTNKDWLYGGIRVSRPDPWRFVRTFNQTFYANKQWTDEKLTIYKNINWFTSITFLNYWRVGIEGYRDFEVLDDLDTRGGPPIIKPEKRGGSVSVTTDSRKRWTVNLFGGSAGFTSGGWERYVGFNVNVQPSGRLQASVRLNKTFARDAAQWIENTDADGDDVEDNVYGTLRRDVVNITTRATYAFSRDLTLEAFLQPFVAAGDYFDIRKLARPKSFDFTPVTIEDNPDFNRKSLRGTMVLRWEYVRGSTLYVVWNTSTLDEARPGEFSARRDLADAFRAPGNHVFVVKLNYWLNL